MLMDLDLNQSINTDTINEDVKNYGEKGPHVKFNGIERDGGLTNVYETETAIPAGGVGNDDYADTFYDTRGDRYSIQWNTGFAGPDLLKNGVVVGGVRSNVIITKKWNSNDYADVMVCSDGSIVALTKPNGNNTQRIVTLNTSGVQTATRNAASGIWEGFVRDYTTTSAQVVLYRRVKNSSTNIDIVTRDEATGINVTNSSFPATWLTMDSIFIYRYKNASTVFGWLVMACGYQSYFISGAAFNGALTTLFSAKSYWSDYNDLTYGGVLFHTVTGDPGLSGTTLTMGKKVGWYTNTLGTFGVQDITYTTGAAPTKGNVAVGPGYCSANILSAGVYTAVTLSNHAGSTTPTGVAMGSTETVMDMRGGVLIGRQEWRARCNLIHSGGVAGTESPSFLSVSNLYYLGQPVSGVGSFDFQKPVTSYNYSSGVSRQLTLVFSDNGYWSFLEVMTVSRRQGFYPNLVGCEPMFKQISDNRFLISVMDPINVFNTDTMAFEMGPIDYTGGMIYNGTVAGAGNVVNYSFSSGVASMIDTGGRILAPDGVPYPLEIAGGDIGTFRPLFYFYINNIATKCGATYLLSAVNTFVNRSLVGDPNGFTYAPEDRVPPPVQSDFIGGCAVFNGVTAFLYPDFLGYVIGNYLSGNLTPFQLFSQNYVFDGAYVYYSATGPDNTLQTTSLPPSNIVARANGLRFIAISPTVAYFYSDFDRSIFVFDGGRTIQKLKRLNQLEVVNSGVYSVRDNTLLLDTANTFIWVRDGIYSEQDKKASQTNLKYYSTDDGIYIVNPSYSWIYSYESLGGSTVVPFTWQSAYYGPGNNVKSNTSAFIIRLYNVNKTGTTWNIKVRGFDGNDFWTENKTLTINASDYNSQGYAVFRVQPVNQKALGISIEISTTSTTSRDLLNQVTLEYLDDVPAIIAASRTV